MKAWAGSFFLVALLLISACIGSRTSGAKVTSSPISSLALQGPYGASPTPWPSYAAVDYERAHPRLTDAQIAAVRQTLSKVKPCQRDLLRYAFPQNSDFLPFVVFFEQPESVWPHVLGQRNIDYNPGEGQVFTTTGMPGDDYSLENDIKQRGCGTQ